MLHMHGEKKKARMQQLRPSAAKNKNKIKKKKKTGKTRRGKSTLREHNCLMVQGVLWGWGRSSGEGNGTALQYSAHGQEPGGLQSTGVTKSRARLSD